MKIEVVIHKDNGEIRRYPVYRMDRQDGIWTARYITIQNGCHVSRKVVIDDEKAQIEVEK